MRQSVQCTCVCCCGREGHLCGENMAHVTRLNIFFATVHSHVTSFEVPGITLHYILESGQIWARCRGMILFIHSKWKEWSSAYAIVVPLGDGHGCCLTLYATCNS